MVLLRVDDVSGWIQSIDAMDSVFVKDRYPIAGRISLYQTLSGIN